MLFVSHYNKYQSFSNILSFELCALCTVQLYKNQYTLISLIVFPFRFRYQNILRKIAKDRGIEEEAESAEIIIYRIRDVNAIQTVNAIFQYCPQFLFQSFLIIYRDYKCVITGK